jgi:hypothetical protein
MIGFLLVSLSPGIPILSLIPHIGIPTDEWFAAIDSDDFDDFVPLINDISFFVSLDYSGLNMIEIIDSVLHVDIVVHLNILRIKHCFVLLHSFKKLYNFTSLKRMENVIIYCNFIKFKSVTLAIFLLGKLFFEII